MWAFIVKFLVRLGIVLMHIAACAISAVMLHFLGVPDFIKRTSLIRYSGRAIEQFGGMIEKFATQEGLTAHERSISIRRHQA